MKHNANLDKLMNEKGFWSFEFFSFCPYKSNTPVKYGNFEFITQGEHGSVLLYTRYLGSNPTFTWLNDAVTNKTYYREYGSVKLINNITYCQVGKSWHGMSKNKTFTPASIVHNIEDAKRFRENLNWQTKLNYSKEVEIKLFKREVKKYKASWEQTRKEVVESAFGISFEEWSKDQVQLEDSHATQFILKVAPMLTRLKDECTLILDQLNEPNGPSKQAKEDFITSYKKFQMFYGNRTFLTALRSFKAKKGKSKKK